MRSFISLLVFALLSGCVSQEVRERDGRIEAQMRAKYDLVAVGAFLKKVVADHPIYDGIRLSADIGDGWRFERIDPPARMRTGAWVLYDQKQEGDEFDLYFWTDHGSQITIQARRIARDQFELVRIKRDDIVELTSKTMPNHTTEPASPGRGGSS